MADRQKSSNVHELTDTFAFWRYDKFPYVLGAEVTKRRVGLRTGLTVVYAPSYMGWFQAFHTTTVARGAGILRDLENMRDVWRNEDAELAAQRIKTADAVSDGLVSRALGRQ